MCHADVVAAARTIWQAPEALREETLGRLLRMADWAERFRREHRRNHPFWGDGSLMTAALAEDPPPEPRLSDPDYCRCLSLVLRALAARGQDLRC